MYSFPSAGGSRHDDIEYFVQATPLRGGMLKVPAAGSASPQTVVIGP